MGESARGQTEGALYCLGRDLLIAFAFLVGALMPAPANELDRSRSGALDGRGQRLRFAVPNQGSGEEPWYRFDGA